jgi:hypothetical protein
MKTLVRQYAVVVALAGAFGFGAATPSLAQSATGAEGRSSIAQYCVPPPESIEYHRFYCQFGPGSPFPPMPASAPNLKFETT